MALTGAGSLYVATKDVDASTIRGENLILPGCFASFELSFDTNFVEAFCLIDGKRKVTATGITEENASLSIEIEFANWTTLQFAFDEIAQESSSVVLPTFKSAVVDGSDEVVDADITAGTASSVLVYRADPDPEFLNVVGVAPTADNEVQVDGAGGKLVFNAGQAGATVQYIVNRTATTINSIGEESAADNFGKLIFSGIIFGTESTQGYRIIIPEIQRTTTPSLSITGDIATLSLEFRCLVPAGQRSPFKLYELDSET